MSISKTGRCVICCRKLKPTYIKGVYVCTNGEISLISGAHINIIK